MCRCWYWSGHRHGERLIRSRTSSAKWPVEWGLPLLAVRWRVFCVTKTREVLAALALFLLALALVRLGSPAALREVCCRLLEDAGYPVMEAATGTEAGR